jgi:hypothetical protein
MASILLADAKGTITSGQREREGVLGAKRGKVPRAGYGTACSWVSFIVLFVLKKSMFCLLVFVYSCGCLWGLLYSFSMSCLSNGKQDMKIQHFIIARTLLKGYVKIGAWD